MKPSDYWEVDEKMPRYDDVRQFEVMIRGHVRTVERIGNRSQSFSPGILLFTDCSHPAQNVICDEQMITAWRFKLLDGKMISCGTH